MADGQAQGDSSQKLKVVMHWTEQHNLLLVRECLLFEPWRYKQGSPERGQVWKRIGEALNALENPFFRVTERSVRDRLNLLMKKFKKKLSDENKASGIEVNDETELEKGLRDIIEQFEDQEKLTKEESNAKKKKMEEEAAQAQEFRLMSLETLGETKKRRYVTSEDETTPPSSKRRRSSNETIAYLREKGERDNELRKQELDARKKEAESVQQLLINQQQQTAQLLQQQQQMTIAFMDVLKNFLPENKPN